MWCDVMWCDVMWYDMWWRVMWNTWRSFCSFWKWNGMTKWIEIIIYNTHNTNSGRRSRTHTRTCGCGGMLCTSRWSFIIISFHFLFHFLFHFSFHFSLFIFPFSLQMFRSNCITNMCCFSKSWCNHCKSISKETFPVITKKQKCSLKISQKYEIIWVPCCLCCWKFL